VNQRGCELMLAVMTYFFRFNAPTWQIISKNLKVSIKNKKIIIIIFQRFQKTYHDILNN